MGFDRLGESTFTIPVSDTQAYRQFGNAVVVNVAETVARHMRPWIICPGISLLASSAVPHQVSHQAGPDGGWSEKPRSSPAKHCFRSHLPGLALVIGIRRVSSPTQ
ncbi:MAG TPA: DNA cytosine methyltransferase [Planctomicrobium sp.]|nr:DNA cytosine methyltransferase [Planctomicrobium sp.]